LFWFSNRFMSSVVSFVICRANQSAKEIVKKKGS
jgi:hypothetical protein